MYAELSAETKERARCKEVALSGVLTAAPSSFFNSLFPTVRIFLLDEAKLKFKTTHFRQFKIFALQM